MSGRLRHKCFLACDRRRDFAAAQLLRWSGPELSGRKMMAGARRLSGGGGLDERHAQNLFGEGSA
jgi:hypothetical protein